MNRYSRTVADAIRLSLGSRAPQLRYSSVEFWDGAHRRSLESESAHEWASVHAEELLYHSFCLPSENFLLKSLTGGLREGSLGDFAGPSPRVLELGCGTSALSETLYDVSFTQDVVAVDFSAEAVEGCRKRGAAQGRERPGLEYCVADARALEAGIGAEAMGTFDIVLDKGLVDAVWCESSATSAISEVARGAWEALRPGGTFVCVSFSSPDLLLPLLERVEREAPPHAPTPAASAEVPQPPPRKAQRRLSPRELRDLRREGAGAASAGAEQEPAPAAAPEAWAAAWGSAEVRVLASSYLFALRKGATGSAEGDAGPRR